MTRVFQLVCFVALVFAGHACASATSTTSATPEPTSSPTPTPVNAEALLQESGKVMEELESFHFRLHHRSGGTPLMPNLLLEEAEGDVIRPDGISVQFTGTFGGFAIKSSLITLGDSSYMTNPLTGKWESVPTEVSPLGFFNPRRGVTSMMARVEGSTLLPSDGKVHRVKGVLEAEALAPLVGATVEGSTVGVELAIDAETLRLLEAAFDGRVTPAEPDGTVRVITLSRFGEPVTIEPPE